MKRLIILFTLLAMATILAWAGEQNKEEKADDKATTEKVEKKETKSEFITTKTGLRYLDLVVGKGDTVVIGDGIKSHYTLWLDVDGKKGKKIQSSKDGPGQPFSFTAGERSLIAGWNEGIVGMRPGGTRQLMIPSKLGWGKRGMGGMIPPDTDVIFELECIEITKK